MFGQGKTNIVIPKAPFVPGDTISGSVALKSKKPVKAKGVSISLIGKQKTNVEERYDRQPEYVNDHTAHAHL